MLLDMLGGTPRPLTPNSTSITLITDQTNSVLVASGFNFPECLIARKHNKHTSLRRNETSRTVQMLLCAGSC